MALFALKIEEGKKMTIDPILLTLGISIAVISSLISGFGIKTYVNVKKLNSMEDSRRANIKRLEIESKEIIRSAKHQGKQIRNRAEKQTRDRRSELRKSEKRVGKKEDQVTKRLETIEKRERKVSKLEEQIRGKESELDELKQEEFVALEKVAQLTIGEAQERLMNELEKEISVEASRKVRESEESVQAESKELAYKIMAQSLQRYASEVVSELTTSSVPLPNEEMKGRLIGKEGRNISALENATGVNLIVDDTPEVVTVSAFDPIRREIARRTVSSLIQDGRIQPARIEELVEKAKEELEEITGKAGEEACYEVKVQGLHPEIVKTMGRLKFRYSYGQNVLQHCIETAHIAASIASELGVNQDVVRRAAFLHDIGKALTHEVEGPHAQVGADLLSRYKVNERVVRAVGDNHGEEGWKSIDAFVVAAADAISGARPGARRESAEAYVKRIETLEQIATEFDGVDKAFAIQAGREMRVMVKPDEIDDVTAMRMARDVTKKIKESMEYPGQIKVVVIRETRAVEYAK